MIHRGLVGLAVLLAVLVAGCTQVSSGDPRPATSVSGSSEPSRPRDVDLSGKDPCALVPESDLTGFDVFKPGVPKQNEEFDSPECSYSGDHHGFWVMLVTRDGIEVWSDGSRDAEVGEIEAVDGFPAITLAGDLTPHRCDVVVDVADGQYLMTTVLPDNSEAPFAETCELAHEFAGSAMSTLLGE